MHDPDNIVLIANESGSGRAHIVMLAANELSPTEEAALTYTTVHLLRTRSEKT